jgi:amiloride-sensitive sodium channel subunit alpha/amiloride-sensitive sodium channel subunit gamma
MFNSGKNASGHTVPLRYLNKNGKWYGLKLELFIGQNNKPFDFLNPSTGAHIFINNYTITPTVFEGVEVSPSKETNIAVSRTLKYRLPHPYSDCIDDVYDENASDSFFYKSIVRSGARYRFTDCINLCFIRHLKDVCGCYDVGFKNLYNLRPCLNLTDIYCDFTLFLNFFESDLQTICGPDCPIECNSEILTFSTSSLDYPSDSYGGMLMSLDEIGTKFPNNSITFEELKKSTLAINIYYEDLKYTVIQEAPTTDIITLIASMGGTLGLFIGVSFLSFVELIEIAIKILFIYIEEKNKKSNQVFNYNHDDKNENPNKNI